MCVVQMCVVCSVVCVVWCVFICVWYVCVPCFYVQQVHSYNYMCIMYVSKCMCYWLPNMLCVRPCPQCNDRASALHIRWGGGAFSLATGPSSVSCVMYGPVHTTSHYGTRMCHLLHHKVFSLSAMQKCVHLCTLLQFQWQMITGDFHRSLITFYSYWMLSPFQ